MSTQPSSDAKSDPVPPPPLAHREYRHLSTGKEFSWLTPTPTSDQLLRTVDTLIRTLQTSSDFPAEYMNCLIQIVFNAESKEVNAQLFCQQPNATILSMLDSTAAQSSAARKWTDGKYVTLLIFTVVDMKSATANSGPLPKPRKFLFQSDYATVTVKLKDEKDEKAKVAAGSFACNVTAPAVTAAATPAAAAAIDKKGTYTLLKVVPGSELVKRTDLQHAIMVIEWRNKHEMGDPDFPVPFIPGSKVAWSPDLCQNIVARHATYILAYRVAITDEDPAELPSNPVGFMVMSTTEDEPGSYGISGLYVAPEWKRCRIGTALLNRAKEQVVGNGTSLLGVGIPDLIGYADTVIWFTSQGFVPPEKNPFFSPPGYPYRMRSFWYQRPKATA